MKRILIFSTAYFPLVGGAEIAVRELTDRLPDFEFHLVTARLQPGLSAVEHIGRVTVHRVGFGLALDKWLLPFLGVRRAEALHAEKPFDLVWAIMASYGSFAAERFKSRHPEVPYLLTLQEGDPLREIERKVRCVRSWFLNVFRRADGLQAISRFLLDWGMRLGFQGRSAEVIPNGVPLAQFSASIAPDVRRATRAEFGFADPDFVVLTTSRLVKKNGVDLLIRALVQLPDSVKLLIVGTGPLTAEYATLVRSLDLTARVVFAGMRSYGDLPRLYAAADAFCRPSRTEGFGNSFIEAMAAGVPVVATPVGGIVDFAQDGVNCLLAAPENSAAVAQAVQKLLDDLALRVRLIAGGRETAARYDWPDLAKRMDALIKKLIV